jgi:hypothetical protein
MALWPEEYEGLRDEARGMANFILEHFAGGVSSEVPTDHAGRLRVMRAALAALEKNPGANPSLTARARAAVQGPRRSAGSERAQPQAGASPVSP